jgi:hypothetical protein
MLKVLTNYLLLIAVPSSRFKLINLIVELLANVTYSVIPAKAGIQNCLKALDSGSRFAWPE